MLRGKLTFTKISCLLAVTLLWQSRACYGLTRNGSHSCSDLVVLSQVLSQEEDHENYNKSKSEKQGSSFRGSEDIKKQEIKPQSLRATGLSIHGPPERTSSYKQSFSSNLHSPRSSVSKNEILQRIKSKKVENSYQLGHQVSSKWSTGTGPRIGCVADYPMKLRVQALEVLNLSPRDPMARTASSNSARASVANYCRIM